MAVSVCSIVVCPNTAIWLSVCAVLWCVQTLLYGCQCFGGFNVHTDFDACHCTRGLCEYRNRVCIESWLGEKSRAPSGTRTRVSIVLVFQLDAVPTELLPTCSHDWRKALLRDSAFWHLVFRISLHLKNGIAPCIVHVLWNEINWIYHRKLLFLHLFLKRSLGGCFINCCIYQSCICCTVLLVCLFLFFFFLFHSLFNVELNCFKSLSFIQFSVKSTADAAFWLGTLELLSTSDKFQKSSYHVLECSSTDTLTHTDCPKIQLQN